MRQRMANDAETEIGVAADEQSKITRLRLEKLIEGSIEVRDVEALHQLGRPQGLKPLIFHGENVGPEESVWQLQVGVIV